MAALAWRRRIRSASVLSSPDVARVHPAFPINIHTGAADSAVVYAVAERAGVQRHTVYRHFPTEEDLFAACSAHFAELHPFPDIGALRGEADPAVRLEAALTELYEHYADTAYMWRNILRDVELVPAIPKATAPFERQLDDVVQQLAAGWGARGNRRAVSIAAIRHAIDFRSWESLVQRGGLTGSQGAGLMRELVEAAVRPT